MNGASPPDFDTLLVTAATWVLLATLGWGGLLVLVALAERVSRGRLRVVDRLACPPRLRPLLLALAGTAVLAPGAAHAAPAPHVEDPGTTPVHVLPVPTRPVDAGGTERPAPAPASRPAPAAPTARTAPTAPTVPTASDATAVRQRTAALVTVRPGDSLWALAQRRLGPDAAATEVADLVARVHRRNLDVVGDDPDLVRPGQQLRFPVTPPPPEAP